MNTVWDIVKLKKLKNLIGKGLSAAEIGRNLAMSKNAVIGKLNRLGWNMNASSGNSKSRKKKSADKKPNVPISKKIAPVKPVVMPRATRRSTVAAEKPKNVVAKVDKNSKTASTVGKGKKTTDATDKPVVKRLPRAVKSAKADKKDPKNLAMHQRIIQHSLEMAALKPNQCRWPIGDPDSENFHFCGETVFVGKPYCYEHCKQAYQFTPPKKK